MKTIVFLLLVCLVPSCTTKHTDTPYFEQISILCDITDSVLVRPSPEKVIEELHMTGDLDKAVSVRIQTITDKVMQPTIMVQLPDGYTTEKENINDIVRYREKVVLGFIDSLRRALHTFNSIHHADTPLSKSEVFEAAAKELQYLTEHPAKKTTVQIYSDLAENSELFNTYGYAGKKLLQNNPEKVVALFEKTNLLPARLDNFHIVVLYNPITREGDIRFRQMASIYAKLFSSRGATFSTQANN